MCAFQWEWNRAGGCDRCHAFLTGYVGLQGRFSLRTTSRRVTGLRMSAMPTTLTGVPAGLTPRRGKLNTLLTFCSGRLHC